MSRSDAKEMKYVDLGQTMPPPGPIAPGADSLVRETQLEPFVLPIRPTWPNQANKKVDTKQHGYDGTKTTQSVGVKLRKKCKKLEEVA